MKQIATILADEGIAISGRSQKLNSMYHAWPCVASQEQVTAYHNEMMMHHAHAGYREEVMQSRRDDNMNRASAAGVPALV